MLPQTAPQRQVLQIMSMSGALEGAMWGLVQTVVATRVLDGSSSKTPMT